MKHEEKLALLKQHIGKFDDFPKKGIVFRDIFTALRNGEVCQVLKELLVSHVKNSCPDVDVIIGLESRGFLFSFLLASELGCACVPVRKKGKLPGECYQIEYELEYGTDIFEIQRSSIQPGQKVIIVDDLLATGGSIESASKLVSKAGGILVEALVVIELTFLEARKRLNCDVHSLVQYDKFD